MLDRVLAVGLKPSAMRGEARLRGLERAVADYLLKDHKPSASQGEARLRGLWQIIYSKTIISVIAWGASFPGVFNTDGGRWLLSDRHARRSPHWGAIVTALVRGGSTSMRTAIMLYLHKPHGKRQITVYILNLYKPSCSPRKLCGTASSFHIRVRWRAACSADNGSASCFILNPSDYTRLL